MVSFHDGLQRVAVFPCEAVHLPDLAFGDTARVDTAQTAAPVVDAEHDGGGFIDGFLEKSAQNVNHKIHRGKIVVQQDNLVQ